MYGILDGNQMSFMCENCVNVLAPCTTNCHICTFSLEKEAVMSEREKEREMERGWEGTNVISLSTNLENVMQS